MPTEWKEVREQAQRLVDVAVGLIARQERRSSSRGIEHDWWEVPKAEGQAWDTRVRRLLGRADLPGEYLRAFAGRCHHPHQTADVEGGVAGLKALIADIDDGVFGPTDAAPAARPPDPAPLAKLDFRRRLGEGGEGEVWEAVDNLGRRVAVKLFHGDSADGQTALQHARAMVRVRHDNVLTVHYVARAVDPRANDGRVVDVVVMERVDGTTLEDRLRSEDRLTAAEAARIGNAILDAIAAFHENDVQHGDLHEGQVLLWDDGRVRVADVFYRGSLRYLNTMTREQRLRHDRDDTFFVLVQLLLRSDVPSEAACAFRDDARCVVTQEALRGRFLSVFQSAPPTGRPHPAPPPSHAEDREPTGRERAVIDKVVDRYCETGRWTTGRFVRRSFPDTPKGSVDEALDAGVPVWFQRGNQRPDDYYRPTLEGLLRSRATGRASSIIEGTIRHLAAVVDNDPDGGMIRSESLLQDLGEPPESAGFVGAVIDVAGLTGGGTSQGSPPTKFEYRLPLDIEAVIECEDIAQFRTLRRLHPR